MLEYAQRKRISGAQRVGTKLNADIVSEIRRAI